MNKNDDLSNHYNLDMKGLGDYKVHSLPNNNETLIDDYYKFPKTI